MSNDVIFELSTNFLIILAVISYLFVYSYNFVLFFRIQLHWRYWRLITGCSGVRGVRGVRGIEILKNVSGVSGELIENGSVSGEWVAQKSKCMFFK